MQLDSCTGCGKLPIRNHLFFVSGHIPGFYLSSHDRSFTDNLKWHTNYTYPQEARDALVTFLKGS